jgi:uncharacterized damage-inducible protein DinB
MKAIDIIRRLHNHRAWVNARLIKAADTLFEGDLRRPFAIGQGSIWQSLVHLYAAEYIWIETLLGDENPVVPGDLPGKLPGNQLGENPITSMEELRTKWSLLEARWMTYLDSLTDESLDEIVYKVSTSSGIGKRHPTSRADILIHVCTHAQYTTAQVVNMLKQAGVQSLPDVMLITLARTEAGTLS